MSARLVRFAPLVALLVALSVVSFGRGQARPSDRDDEVFLQAAFLHRTHHVRTIEAIAEAATIQYGWGGALADRLRSSGDIQTYALIPVWSRIGGFRTGPNPGGQSLYVTSARLSDLSQIAFVLSVLLLYWAVLPLGRGVALCSALLMALGHPFRHGPALFDPWVMPAATAAIGCWLRDRHRTAAALAVAATLIKPNYLFLLPAFALAAFVPAGKGDPEASSGWRPAAVHVAAAAGVVIAYLFLAATHVIATGQYTAGVRSGYAPAVLAYSSVETLSFTYRAGVQQLRTHWPIYPWTVLNGAALALLARRLISRVRLPRTGALLAALIAIPVLADFAVLPSVHAYEDGGHFRWINVAIIAMAIALPLAYREVARLAAGSYDRWRSSGSERETTANRSRKSGAMSRSANPTA